MALSQNNQIQVINFFSYGAIEAVMVSYWDVSLLTGAITDAAWAEVIAHAFMDGARIKDVLSSNAQHYKTVFNNLDIAFEYGEFTGDIAGEATGATAPSFLALSVKQIVPTRLTRAGYKRIPFIGESTYDGQDNVLGVITKTALESFFGAPFEFNYTYEGDPVTIELTPLVIGRTPDVNGVYQLDRSRTQYVSDAAVQVKVTSQNSRKE